MHSTGNRNWLWHSATNSHEFWSEAKGKEKRSQRRRIILRMKCCLVRVWLPPHFSNQSSPSGLPVGRMWIPDAHLLNLFSWDLNLKLEYQQSPAFPPLFQRPLCSLDLMSRFLALLTEEQLSSSSTMIWRVTFFRYSFCFTSLICLKVKEKGKGCNFPNKFEKDPKISMGQTGNVINPD